MLAFGSSLSVVKVVIGVKVKCKRSACFHILLTLVVKVVKVVIGVKVICLVDFFNVLRSIITNKTNVPADLQSAGIKYKDLLIR